MRRWLFAVLFLLPSVAFAADFQEHRFLTPIDALSVGIEGKDMDLEMSAYVNGIWTDWTPLEVEDEQDPALRESNLVIFPDVTSRIRIRGDTKVYHLHPIHVSHDPVRVQFATIGDAAHPQILSRREWGADESLTVRREVTPVESQASTDATTTGRGDTTATSPRVRECEELIEHYPSEFRSIRRVTEDSEGKQLRWPRTYSKDVKVLAIHHTGQSVKNDPRPPQERIRAILAYHAKTRGWGDIGYNFLIDENGQIYEGRAGGAYVVGGHAYCNNINTFGIALLGNLDTDEPSQSQMEGLQWLLHTLAEQYEIDLEEPVTFHGITYPSPIVGHRDLLSTDCPGYYAYTVLDQIRRNVIRNDLTAFIDFPDPPVRLSPAEPRVPDPAPEPATVAAKGTLTTLGERVLSGRPGQEQLISVQFRANGRVTAGETITPFQRSHGKIGLFQDRENTFQRVEHALVLSTAIGTGEVAAVRLKVVFPPTAGTYTFSLGELEYTMNVSGRPMRTAISQSTPQTYRAPAATYSRTRRLARAGRTDSLPPPTRRQSTSSFSPASSTLGSNPLIRIRLSALVDSNGGFTLEVPENSVLGSRIFARATTLRLQKNGDQCEALEGGRSLARGVLRIDPQRGIMKIASWDTPRNRFRGMIECHALPDGTLVLINELPLEDYMAGLAEEDDAQHYEKQRAFAIAARSYAQYYLDPSQRKFPGKPYDGSDTGETFQAYGGVAFEEKNPQWVRAARDTAGKVMTVDGKAIKTPYFSASDGRTRSPEEVGWTTFPHKEIFSAKDDPGCTGPQRGHGVGMSGCGAKFRAERGDTAEQILAYYYPGAVISTLP